MWQRCPLCQEIDRNFEEWAPYQAIWSRVGGRPWTRIMRDNPGPFWVLALPLLILTTLYVGRRNWLVIVAFILGALVGHVYW